MKTIAEVQKGCRALLVADDLTGACDSGIAFAKYGFDTRVLFSTSDFHGGEVIAVTTNSRRLHAKEAGQQVEAACGMVSIDPDSLLFKKIDSTLRGHVIAECDAMMLSMGCRMGVMVPALPSQGRIVEDGRLKVQDLAGNWELDARKFLADQGAGDISLLKTNQLSSPSCVTAEMMRLASTGVRYLLCDAVNDEDLLRIAEALMECGDNMLWIGSAGLASAAATLLAARHSAKSAVGNAVGDVRLRKLVFCVGSDHAVTKRQLQHLKDAMGVQTMAVSSASAADVRTVLGRDNVMIVTIDTTKRHLLQLKELLHVAHDCGMNSMVLSGGDTAELVCRTMDAKEISLETEIAGGIARGRLHGGLLDKMTVVTKSGGFGSHRCLEDLMHLLHIQAHPEDQVYL